MKNPGVVDRGSVNTPESDAIPAGKVIGGCTIEGFIAVGGMGSIYRARKELLERTVAVKILRPELVHQKDLLSRFLREARLAASFDHPSIIKVFDVGEEDGLYYIVMEYVEGKDLKTITR
jgi:serine/threonine-protein kinase